MRGQPFELGNKLGKGRPPGSRNKKSIFQDAMEGKGSIEIIETAKLQALKKDPTALRLCSPSMALRLSATSISLLRSCGARA